MSPDTLLSIQQVADYLQLNPSTVYQWAQHGKLPALKLGGRWRFRRGDIEAWLNEQARGHEAAPDLAPAPVAGGAHDDPG